MPRQTLSAAEAARALGISVDTLRRWDRDGKITVERDAANRRVVPVAEVERLRAPHGDETLSARNRFRGVVRSVELDGLLARVEIDVTEPSRVVAIVTRESVGRARAEGGDERGRRRQVDVGDGGAMRRRLAFGAVLVAVGRARHRLHVGASRRPGDGLRGGLAHRGLPADLAGVAVPVRAARTSSRSRSRAARPADVFASASPVYTQGLFRDGLVEKPRTFATNSLVLAVPRSNPAKIRSVFDLAKRPKLKLVVAGQKVPIGLYTREVLKRLALLRVLRKAVSQEPDVKGIVGKLALGEADAGFVYATDVRAASSRLLAIPLPKRSQPTVVYEVAVVKGSKNREAALEFVADLLSTDGRRAAPERRLRASVRSPFAVVARARDRAHALVPSPPDRRDLPRHPAGQAARRDERPGRGRRARRDAEDDPDRERGDPAGRDAGGVPDRIALVPRPAAARDRGRAAARAAAGGRGHRAAGRVRALRPARRHARRARALDPLHAARGRASRSCSSPARSTSAPRSRRSSPSTRP